MRPPHKLLGVVGLVAAAAAVSLLQGDELAQASVRAAQPENEKTISSDGARWFLDARQSEQAELAGILPEGTRSVLRIEKRLRHGEFVWRDEGVPEGPLRVRVDLASQTISVFRAGHEIAAAVILYGAAGMDTPVGQHPVRAKVRHHRSTAYDAPMPYTLWLTSDGVAIHGSDVQRGFATHGCVGVPLEFARRLFEQAEVGDLVEIVRPSASGPRLPVA